MAGLEDSITLSAERLPPTTIHDDQPQSRQRARRRILIYFIPGNPGLIEFYRPFLAHLHAQLQTPNNTTDFTLVGNSLAGFHLTSPNTPHPPDPPLPLNLQEQITHVETQLRRTASAHDTTEVLLIGHSVGAYIMMSLLDHATTDPHSPLATTLNITAGIGLFPTIVDLHASPHGRKARFIAPVPYLPRLLQALARVLCWMLSFETLVKLVQRITGQPAPATKVTAAFLSSPMGVRQAIYLAQHELREMREDRWGDGTWAVSRPSPSSPKAESDGRASADGVSKSSSRRSNHRLFFYWAANDDWIANSTRDAMIAARAAVGGRVWMEIDEKNGLPHDFCVRQGGSEVVAQKVAGYVRDTLSSDGEGHR